MRCESGGVVGLFVLECRLRKKRLVGCVVVVREYSLTAIE